MPLMTERPQSQSSTYAHSPKYRAPASNHQALVVPALASQVGSHYMPRLVSVAAGAQARSVDEPFDFKLGGASLLGLRSAVRQRVLRAAIEYTSVYRDVPAWATHPRPGTAWLVAGHQPELFHPGVWFKNFLMSQAAIAKNAIALNLVIDNDLCRSPGIRVPVRARERGSNDQTAAIRTESVAFDAPGPAVAWERRSILNQELFKTFPERVIENLVSEIESPIVERLWVHAREAAERTGNLGWSLAQARHALEADLGLETLELPLSQLCADDAFAHFSLAVLTELPRFHQIYNDERELYRQANGIRSESHPVPALAERSGWLESPWWVYRDSDATRRRLFVRAQSNGLLLSDQAGWELVIEDFSGNVTSDAIAQWKAAGLDGVMLRPRALITTMFARLMLGDVFLHGIGGGKYDQMTDAIIRRFFGIEPPPMCVATATVHLPIEQSVQHSLADHHRTVEQVQAKIRSLRFHPEEHLKSPDADTVSLLQRKRELLQSVPPRGEKWEWNYQLSQVNKQLAALTTTEVESQQARLIQLAEEERQLKLILSREFSFCLFEQEHLVGVLSRLAADQFPPTAAK